MKALPKGKQYHESDLSNKEWRTIEHLFNKNKGPGRKAEHNMRHVLNGIFYLLRTGCQWRNIPKYYPPWSVCRYYFEKWTDDGTLSRMNDALRQKVRIKAGRDPEPTGAIIDSQSKKTTEAGGERGFDGFKRVKGRKRFIIVDTMGNLLDVYVTTANTSEQAGGKTLIEKAYQKIKTIQIIWADGGYEGVKKWLSEDIDIEISIVERPKGQKGFVVLSRRWVVERTLAWLCRYRRLMVDYEHHIEASTGMLLLASIHRMIRTLAR